MLPTSCFVEPKKLMGKALKAALSKQHVFSHYFFPFILSKNVPFKWLRFTL